MRIIGYVRCSTEHQDQSLDVQRAKLEAYAKLYDVQLIHIVEDFGQSAKSLDRPGIKYVVNALKTGAADGILVAKLDRLTRSVTDMGWLIENFFSEKKGKTLMSVGDQIDTRSAVGRLVLNVLTSVSQWERETIGERTKDALKHRKNNGKVYGPIPFGFDGHLGSLVAVPREQAALDFIVTARRTGKSYRDIAKSLQDQGMPTKRGAVAWSAMTVYNMYNRERERMEIDRDKPGYTSDGHWVKVDFAQP